MNILTPAALEAAAQALRHSRRSREGNRKTPWEDVHPIVRAEWEEDAAAAFNAAIDRLIKEGRAEVCHDFVWGDDGEDHKFGLGEKENGEDDMPTVVVVKGEP